MKPTSDTMAPDPPPTAKEPNAAQAEATDDTGVAADAVFNTAELLEKILIDLPLRTLFTSQRVSKQWKAAISSSKKVQQIMFLRAADAEVAFRRFEHLRDEYTTAGDDSQHMYDFDLRACSLQALPLKTVDRSKKHALQASLNPLFTLDLTSLEDRPYTRADYGEVALLQDSVLLARFLFPKRASGALLNGCASCFDMFICQPPPKTVKLRCSGRSARVDCPDGVRVRDVVKGFDQMRLSLRKAGVGVSPLRKMYPSDADIFSVQFAGTILNKELGDALMFCSSTEHGVEDPSTKKGVTYDD